MTFPVPTLRRICVLKIVNDIKGFCPGVNFRDLGKYQFVVGPFEYLSSTCIEAIFQHVISTRQLDTAWLSLLVVTHLRSIDFTIYPSAVNVPLFKMLKQRCKHLEQLIIPNCKKIPNKSLCDVLQQNPSLLYLDISNKVSPKVDASVVHTLAHSCRYLSVLKLSDFRVEDPKCLLVLCGKVILPNSVTSKSAQTTVSRVVGSSSRSQCSLCIEEEITERDQPTAIKGGETEVECVPEYRDSKVPDLATGCNLPDLVTLKATSAASLSPSNIAFHVHHIPLSGSQFIDQSPCDADESDRVGLVPLFVSSQIPSPMDHQDHSALTQQLLPVDNSSGNDGTRENVDSVMCSSSSRIELSVDDAESAGIRNLAGQNNFDFEQDYHPDLGACCEIVPSASGQIACPDLQQFPTREEHENQLARRVRDVFAYMQVSQESPPAPSAGSSDGSEVDRKESNSEMIKINEGDGDEDLYENDDPVVLPLNVEDHSSDFGCLELETLWLDNVNLNDQVCAVLLQSLLNLRDLNLSDTDICNPWRLLDPVRSSHLRLLEHLDVKSTALSRTALEMIPKYHPNLHKFSISSTTLPPRMYANIGKLTGVADLELIGGQFYPCEPAEIFELGISPAINAIGIHLRSLNLSYFAHVDFEVIVTNCPRIEHLNLSSATLSVSYPCVSLGDNCPQLVSLNLGFISIDTMERQGEELDPVPDENALEKMLGQPKLLEELDLSGQAVTDEIVKSVFPVKLHPLCSINLSRCHHVTIAGVDHIWEQCPHLRGIDLSHCRQITLTDFQSFEKRCHSRRPVFKQEGKLHWI